VNSRRLRAVVTAFAGGFRAFSPELAAAHAGPFQILEPGPAKAPEKRPWPLWLQPQLMVISKKQKAARRRLAVTTILLFFLVNYFAGRDGIEPAANLLE
jgi:hypothetical protein